MILSYLLDELVCLRSEEIIIRRWRRRVSWNMNVIQYLWNNLSSLFEIFY